MVVGPCRMCGNTIATEHHYVECGQCGAQYAMGDKGLFLLCDDVDRLLAQRDRVTHHVIGELDEKTTVVVSWPCRLGEEQYHGLTRQLGDVFRPARIVLMDSGGRVDRIVRDASEE